MLPCERMLGEEEDADMFEGALKTSTEKKGHATADAGLPKKGKVDLRLEREIAAATELAKQIQALEEQMATATAEIEATREQEGGDVHVPAWALDEMCRWPC